MRIWVLGMKDYEPHEGHEVIGYFYFLNFVLFVASLKNRSRERSLTTFEMTDAFALLSFRTDVRNLSPSIFIFCGRA